MSRQSIFYLFIISSVLCSLVCLISMPVNAQKCLPIYISTETAQKFDLGCVSASDTGYFNKKIKSFLLKSQKKGHLAASLSGMQIDSFQIQIKIYLGPQIQCIHVGAAQSLLAYPDSCMSIAVFLKTNARILHSYQQNGYPFATIFSDTLSYDSSKRRYAITPLINPGPLVLFDSIHLPETSTANKLNRQFFNTWLGWKRGKPYRHSVLNQVNGRIASLPFLRNMGRQPAVRYYNNQAHLFVDAKLVPVSRVDGILGLAPSGQNAKPVLTGELNLNIENISNRGIALMVEARRIASNTSKIRMQNIWRCPFGLPIVLQTRFSLLRQDTFMLVRTARIQAGLVVGSGLVVSIFAAPEAATRLSRIATPANIASRRTAYGVALEKRNLDQPFFTRSGYEFQTEISAAQKKWGEQNNRIIAHYTALFESGLYTPIGSKWVMYTRLQTKLQFADSLSSGEAYQFGGFNSLRGFAENSLLSHRYGLLGLEGRYFFEQQAYLNFFSDLAWLRPIALTSSNKLVAGLGAGLNFATQTGIFSFGYALPASQNRIFRFDESKIYFGFVARF